MRKIFILLSLSVFSYSSFSDKLDGIIGPSVFVGQHFADVESGSSRLYKFEFTRLSRYFGIDARLGSGKSYTEFGGALRLFRHFYFNSDVATGVTVGGGVGGMIADLGSPNYSASSQKQSDLVVHAFSRYIYDFGNNVGLGVELEYQLVPYRAFSLGTPSYDRTNRHRIFLGLNLLFDPGI